MKNRILSFLLWLSPVLGFAQTWTVNSTAGIPDYTDCFHKKPTWVSSYPTGTLAWALDQAANYAGTPKKIIFNLPSNSSISWANANPALCIANLEIDGTISGGNVTFTNTIDKVLDIQGTGMKLTNLKFTTPTPHIGDGVFVTGNGNTISGCEFFGFGQNEDGCGASIRGNNNIVTGSTFYNCSNHGLFVLGGSNTITQSTFYGNTNSGVSIRGDRGFTASSNTVDNCISYQNKNGFACEYAANTNIFQNNYAYSNTGYGILLENSGSNKVCGNTIGLDKSGVSKGNGDGIGITTFNSGTAANNSIGSIDGSCAANIITQNGNGVVVLGAAATNNTIVKNSIFCNTKEGISLITSGNSNYGQNTTSTPLFIEISEARSNYLSGKAPLNARIDIYTTDPACDVVCASSNTDNLRQGKTWIATVNADGTGYWEYQLTSPATRTNTIVTATSATGSTSEFAFCKSSCITPSKILTVTPSALTVCSNKITASNPQITVKNGEANVTYTLYKAGNLIQTKVNGAAVADVVFSNLSAYLTSGTVNTFTIKAQGQNCTSTVDLDGSSAITVNTLPNAAVTVTPLTQTICEGTPAAQVSISNPQAGVTYTYAQVSGIASGAVPFTPSNLSVGLNKFYIKADITACATVILTDTAQVTVDKKPDLTLGLNGSTVCIGKTGSIKILSSENGVTYTVKVDASSTIVASGTGNGNDLTISGIPAGTIHVFASKGTCGAVELNTTTAIKVNPLPLTTLNVSATPSNVCVGAGTTIKVAGSQSGYSYQLQTFSGIPVGAPQTGTGDTLRFTVSNIGTGTVAGTVYTYKVQVTNTPCDAVFLNAVNVTVKSKPGTALDVQTSTSFCSSDTIATVVVKNSESGVIYEATLGGKLIGKAGAGNGGDLILHLPISDLLTGPAGNIITITATNSPCGAIPLSKTVKVIVNAPTAAKTITVDKNAACQGSGTSPVLTIVGAEAGVKYDIYNNEGTNPIGSVTATVNGDLAFTLSSGLVAGANTITVKGTLAPCASVNMNNGVSVTVNTNVDPNITVSVPSKVCISTAVTASIQNAQAGVTYIFTLNGSAIDSITASASATVQKVFDKSHFTSAGTYTISVTGKILGCTPSQLNFSQPFTVYNNPNLNLGLIGDTVCSGTDAQITIKNAENGVSYIVNKGNTYLTTVTKDPVFSDLTFQVSTAGFSTKELNQIFVIADNGVCPRQAVTSNALVGVVGGLDYNAFVRDSITCRLSPKNFFIDSLVFGATSYSWSTRFNATVVTNPNKLPSGRAVSIDFNTIPADKTVDTVYVSANVSDAVTCTSSLAFPVRIFKSPQDSIPAPDTLCVQPLGVDSVYISHQYFAKNGVAYNWSVLDGLPKGSYRITYYKSKLNNRDSIGVAIVASVFTSAPLHYTLSIDVLSACGGGQLQQKKSVILVPVPVANAGLDLDTTAVSYPAQIVLDGSKTTIDNGVTHAGSSINADPKHPYFTYKWTALDANSHIEGSDSALNTLAETYVIDSDYKLTVTSSIKKSCAATDVIHVHIKPIIDPSTGITPNGDNKNDTWVIHNLEFYPNNNIKIFNQWGSIVYEANPYSNNNPWQGTHNGEDLPMATYYYILDLGVSGIKPIAGSISIVK